MPLCLCVPFPNITYNTMSKDILEEIIAHKRIEIAEQEKAVSAAFLEKQIEGSRPARSLKQSLLASPTGIIAEFKRRSPSKGWIKQDADAARIPAGYEQAGAAALSILTDERFFGGSLRDIRTARPTVSLPILRKDFIISPYQLLQAKAVQADAVLLIASALTRQECLALAREAHTLGLETLLEIHTEAELEYLSENIDVVGINNRHLGTFHTDASHSLRLIEALPPDVVKISESGISSPATVRRLRQAGFRGFLIGEAFMKTPNPEESLKHFIQNTQ